MEITSEDRDYLAAVIYGEARGESPEGQAAVAHVVLNRAANTNQSVQQVATDRAQFTALSPADPNRSQIERAAQQGSPEWRQAQELASAVLSGSIPDPTRGADHYYNPRVVNPDWGPQLRETAAIGGHRFGTLPWNTPNPSANVAPLNFGTQPAVQTVSAAQTAIGDIFGPPVVPNGRPGPPSVPPNAQVAQPYPAAPVQSAALPPVNTPPRTLANYTPPEFQIEIAPGANARVAQGWDQLQPDLLGSLEEAVSLLPGGTQDKLRVTSTVRPESVNHRAGQAVDIRNSNLSQLEEAQVVAALSRAGMEGIGVYAPDNPQGFGPHIHADTSGLFNKSGSSFQPNARADNAYLSGTQPNSGLYDAIDSGSKVSDAWFGWAPPTPTPSARAQNQGDGSLDAYQQSSAPAQSSRASPVNRAETTPRPSDMFETVWGTRSVSVPNPAFSAWEALPRPGTVSPTNFQYAAQDARTLASQRAAALPPAPPRTIIQQVPVQRRVPVQAPTPQARPNTPTQLTPPSAAPQTSLFGTINGWLNQLTGNAANAPAPNAWEVQSGVGGGVAYGGTDQPYTSNANSRSNPQSESNSGGGSGGTVICTYFFNEGEITRWQYGVNIMFTAKHTSDQTLRGYHFWAIPYVQLMRRNRLARAVMLPVLKARTHELAHQLGKRKHGHLGGKLARLALEPVSWLIGAFVGSRDWTHLWGQHGR